MSDRNEQAPDKQPAMDAREAVPANGTMGVKQKGAPSPKLDRLPPYRVLLHNDELVDMGYVVDAICDLTPLSPHRAATIMLEANSAGVALMLTTHRERAELYVDQFASKGLTVTMEAEK